MTQLTELRLLVDQQDYLALRDQAEPLIDAVVAARPLLSIALSHLGQPVAAIGLLEGLTPALLDHDADALTDWAAALILTGKREQAREMLETVLESQPEHALALARLGFCHFQQGDLDQAKACYERSLVIAPSRISVQLSLISLYMLDGDAAAAQGRLDLAREEIEHQQETLSEVLNSRLNHQIRILQLELWLLTEQTEVAEQWLNEARSEMDEEGWLALVSGFARIQVSRDRLDSAEQQLRLGLKAFPESVRLAAQLAELVNQVGRTGQAVQLLRRAIRLARQQELPQAMLWLQLGRVCLQQLTAQARKAAEQALECIEQEAGASLDTTELVEEPSSLLDKPLQGHESTPRAPLYWQAQVLLAQVDSQEQNFSEAEQRFLAVLEQQPQSIAAMQGLGQQYMQLGRVDDAIALYERIKELDPATGYSALINARKFPEDEATLERLELIARQPGMGGSVRAGLLLQLASAWEKRKDYDRAFALALEGNEANKKQLPYDPKAHRQSCARIRHAFSRSFYQHRPDCGHDSQLPVFVLGMPRSGTTLVEQILASHSQIFGAGELGVIPQRIQGINRWERHVGSGRVYPDCADDLTPYMVEGIANGILKELKELAAEDKPDALHVVDKLPHNFENVGLIKFLFPNARIISVRRDPRDIAMSNFFIDFQAKHGGMGFAYDLEWIGQQLADHNLLMHHWSQVFPGEILELQYEALLDDPEGQARRMLEYVGVEWEPEVLEYTKLDRAVKTASVWQVRQPIYKTSKAKWKRYERHIAPLIQGTNAKIEWEPIDMLALPEPGLLTQGVEFYRAEQLDDAELSFQKMLHHNPEHAACQYMLGLVYCQKGHLDDGIELMDAALKKAPWHREWKANLVTALMRSGQTERAEPLQKGLEQELAQKEKRKRVLVGQDEPAVQTTTALDDDPLVWLEEEWQVDYGNDPD